MTNKIGKTMAQLFPVEKIKKGELVVRIRKGVPSKVVYQTMGYCRFNKAYTLGDWNDISRAIYVKKGTLLALWDEPCED